MDNSLPITGCLATRECKVNERGRALKNIFRTDLRNTCTKHYANYHAISQYHVPFINFILYCMISEIPRKLLKFNAKHHLESELNFSVRSAPVSEIAPIR